MRLRNTLRFALMVVMLGAGGAVRADGTFATTCAFEHLAPSRCTPSVADLVTAKFTRHFPAAQFELFLHAKTFSFSNGGYSAYGVAGVVPRDSGQFPARRLAATAIDTSERVPSVLELADLELGVVRQAVKNLMDQCELSPDCDLYRPFEGRQP